MRYNILSHPFVSCLCLSAMVTAPSGPAHGAPLSSEALPPPAQLLAGQPLMRAIPAAQSGFKFVSELQLDHPLSYLYHAAFACSGVAIGDIDADGWPDIFCVGGAGKNALFRQVPPAGEEAGTMRFKDITTASPGLDGGEAWGAGCALADLDLDGDLDLYICRYDQPNAVFLNNGGGRYSLAAKPTGLEIRDACHAPAFADYDNDGDLDLYLLTNRYEDPEGYRGSQAITMGKDGKPAVKRGFEKFYRAWFEDFDHWGIEAFGRADYLLRNDGPDEDGTPHFTDVTQAAGIGGRGDGNSVTWWDYNRDGHLDLYVGNDFISPDRLYHNNGDGTFTDVIAEAIPHSSWFSMGADFADLDGDGWPELLVADMSATNHFKQKTTMGVMGGDILRRANHSSPPQYMRNALYLNTRAGAFLEAAYLAGLASSDWTWSVLFADFDLDGNQDLFLSNGTPRAMNDSDLELSNKKLSEKHEFEYMKDFPPRPEKNLAFQGLGDLRFADVSDAWGIGEVGVSYSGAYGDLDRDGDLDLVVLNVDAEASLYRNTADNPNRVAIELCGKESDRRGVGARIEIEAGGKLQSRQVIPGRGFLGYCDTTSVFGLGDAGQIDRLTVSWPSGARQRFEKLAAGKRYTITESAGEKPARPALERGLFATTDLELRTHEEKPYDDFKHQSLLPNSLSALGPAAAWGDIDADGDDDLFLGGAAGQAGALYRNEGGKFSELKSQVLSADAGCEDMGAVFLDADIDGDLDLYVASGSYEFPAGHRMQRDRLYLNNGTGELAAAPGGSIPGSTGSNSCAVAADYDRDGDLDLFVGGRVVPRAYPTTPGSALLRNDGGTFTDVTEGVAPGLSATGMVTAALWSDADGDGDPDLLVAHEWGPVKLYQNNGGKLNDATEGAGLAPHSGWWNSIAGGDLDGDGDIDYVAGNQGHNTKYHASASKPVELYYGDYHGDGKNCIVEAEWEGDVLYPVRGKSCSTRAMPQLGDKFKTFRSFAAASLQEIYSPLKLDGAIQFKATTLDSAALINDGSGKFEFVPLPHLAQISPVFGIAIEDFDADGARDIFLAQNFFGPQSETGRFDGGRGMLLRGDGEGGFAPLEVAESGVSISGAMTSAQVADLDGDARPDLLVSRNGGSPVALRNQPKGGSALCIRLKGPQGNPAGIGATVKVSAGPVSRIAEIHAGSGYLGACAAAAFFTFAEPAKVSQIEVRWPDGVRTTHDKPDAEAGTITLSRAKP